MRKTLIIAIVSIALVALLAGCGGRSQAQRRACWEKAIAASTQTFKQALESTPPLYPLNYSGPDNQTWARETLKACGRPPKHL